MEHSVQVAIVVRHPRSRYGLRALLATLPGVEVIWEAANGPEAVVSAEACQPDVVLVDLQMPGRDGLQAIWHIKERWPNVRVVALTLYGGDEARIMAAGADGFLVKGCATEELFLAISPNLRSTTPPDPPRASGLWKAALGGQTA
jgi:DNA-binding NarL/FixJ family response regulator